MFEDEAILLDKKGNSIELKAKEEADKLYFDSIKVKLSMLKI